MTHDNARGGDNARGSKTKGVWKYLFWGVASAVLAAVLAWSVVPSAQVDHAQTEPVVPIR